MARGWESKAVEDQQQAAEERALRNTSRGEVTPAERLRREKLESLRLSHARTLARLDRPLTRAHRDMLQRTRAALEAEMEKLKAQ